MATRYVMKDAHGRWSVYEECPGGDVWLAEFESKAMAYELAAVPELQRALSDLISVAVENLNSTVHPEIGAAFQAIAKVEGRA